MKMRVDAGPKPHFKQHHVWCLVLLCALATGCKTPPLQAARDNFYQGNFSAANTNLTSIPADDKDAVLYLMERGMIRQALGDYDGSSADWHRAADKEQVLETYSVSKGAASLVVNDSVQDFRGAPFERIMLYTFLAKNYLAQANWDYAAICARNIISRADSLDGYPDFAYGRYMAGFCLEMIDDAGNAAIQYKTAAKLVPHLQVDEKSGFLRRQDASNSVPAQIDTTWDHELVCFVLSGRIPVGEVQSATALEEAGIQAELHWQGHLLGYAMPLANTADLIVATQKKQMLAKAAKTSIRVAIKYGVSEFLRQQNEALGFLAFLLLFSTEQPDWRRWETLPLWLGVARVACPAELEQVTVVFSNSGTRREVIPMARHGKTFIAVCRDLPAP